MNPSPQPRLAPPGAGLPKPELLIARLIFRLKRRLGNRNSFITTFHEERARVALLLAGCNDETAASQVLIPRLPGMEDSSRHWSVWMTLDHLRIVHGEIGVIIDHLARGLVPPKVASTAAVKPNPAVTASVVPAYEASCEEFLALVAAHPDLLTAGFPHPWFGPLNALDWLALAGTHLAIHRGQMEKIIATVKSQPPQSPTAIALHR